MVTKTKFEEKLAVIRVKKQYAAPYLKYRYFYMKRKDLKNEVTFKDSVDAVSANWPPDVYMFKMSTGKVFARFRVSNGRVTLLYRASPATGEEYPIWEFFRANEARLIGY